ncbi:hypothetical protein O9H85_36135 [Paenibacillus filicis]|uniref:Uncharacterized protein n=1 Tax=Paenibacillus gyeongsangnamensis TaxID=3388067 RepID=A0ABT4QLB1_9BACL|nr:hypothetical protein [Paenibacillus filicis]MCZ8517659.1 hypothetical protein [Paenibacillus filicis]
MRNLCYANYKEIRKYVKNEEPSSSEEVIEIVKQSYVSKNGDPDDQHFTDEKIRYQDRKKWIKGDILVKDLLRISMYPCADWVLHLTNSTRDPNHTNDKSLRNGLERLHTLNSPPYTDHYNRVDGIYNALQNGSFKDELRYVTILQWHMVEPFVQDGNHRLLALAKQNVNNEIKCYIGYNESDSLLNSSD